MVVATKMGYRKAGQPENADCIFVFAGRPGRKRFGLELFKQGYAPQILFSVGRFEWRGFLGMGLKHDSGLAELVQKIPPVERHFFVHVDEHGARSFRVPKGRLGTLSEARGVSRFAQEQGIRSLLVVSSGCHLRRACLSIERSAAASLDLIPVAVPRELDSMGYRLTAAEYVKYFCYRLFFAVDAIHTFRRGSLR